MAVTGSFTVAGQSASFQVKNAAQPGDASFNLFIDGTGVGTIQLERQPAGASSWYPVFAGGTQLYQWSYSGTAFSESAGESEPDVVYRLNCTAYTSGTINYRLSQ